MLVLNLIIERINKGLLQVLIYDHFSLSCLLSKLMHITLLLYNLKNLLN